MGECGERGEEGVGEGEVGGEEEGEGLELMLRKPPWRECGMGTASRLGEEN